MSKYVDRIMDEIAFNFTSHFTDKEDRIDFLKELIEELKNQLEFEDNCDDGDARK